MTALYHHGVSGQKWGVRHGPPYPIDSTVGDITIKKGTSFKRLSIHQENVSKGHAYVTYLKNDSEHYKGFFGARLKAMNKGAAVYSIDLKAANDMKAPSKQKRLDTFLELYSKDPIIAKELGKYYKSDWHYFTPLPTKFYEHKYSKLSYNDLKAKGYDTFARSLGGNEYIRGEYFKELSKKGYSFVTDDMDANRFGKEPTIVFDRQKSLKYIGQNEVSAKEITDTWKQRGTYINKK
ncbi:hypothetical protein AGMMS49975_11790 [Clostridia bacterium]|nr:hypothetical protein AGMMS49975_11790 [Clostridia bacterium]